MVRWVPVLLLLACSETPRTEVVLVVDSDMGISELDQIDVLVTGPEMRMQSSMALLGAGEPPLPRTLGIVHGGGALGPFEAVVTGRLGGAEVAERRAVFSFVLERTLVLTMHLVAACRDVDCPGDQTCTEDGCAPADRGVLPGWNGTPPRLSPDNDGGVDAPTNDVGTPDAADDVGAPDAPEDVGSPDVGTPDVGTPDMCVSMPEVCNDLDDDCDTDVDEEFDFDKDEENCGFCGNVCMGTEDTCCDGVCAVDTGMMGGC